MTSEQDFYAVDKYALKLPMILIYFPKYDPQM